MAATKVIQPKALLFDVFGTVVNWRLTITETLQKRATDSLSSPSKSLSPSTRDRVAATDWAAFAEAWRNTYVKFTRNYHPSKPDSGNDKVPFKTVDEHYHDSLVELLNQHEFQDLWTAKEISEISKTWHFLVPWKDSSAALEALNRQGFQTCTLSNGNVSLLKDLAKFAHLPWTHIFSSENFGAYKPSPEVYLGAAKKLGLEPGECAMVAAHLTDLRSARKCGLKTIYVEREQEEGWTKERVNETKKEGWVDIWVGLEDGEGERRSFLELARILAR